MPYDFKTLQADPFFIRPDSGLLPGNAYLLLHRIHPIQIRQ